MNTEINAINHLGIIMDGNARWAEKQGIPTAKGHKAGVETARKLLLEALELKIPYLTLYAFSSENWQRSKEEISFLLNLLSYYLKKETALLNKNGIKLKVIGKLDRLNVSLQKRINEAVALTENNDKMTLSIAFSYGGRLEIVDACQKILDSGKKTINEKDFKNYLYDPDMPDVDLLIRTSGVLRISNFLLWQIAYAELFFSKKYWPDFNKTDLMEAINEYSKRKRRFGSR